jgi:hypothetical protein
LELTSATFAPPKPPKRPGGYSSIHTIWVTTEYDPVIHALLLSGAAKGTIYSLSHLDVLGTRFFMENSMITSCNMKLGDVKSTSIETNFETLGYGNPASLDALRSIASSTAVTTRAIKSRIMALLGN